MGSNIILVGEAPVGHGVVAQGYTQAQAQAPVGQIQVGHATQGEVSIVHAFQQFIHVSSQEQ